MTEWGVVGVLIALAGLIALLVKPMLSLTRSITELTENVKSLKSDTSDLTDTIKELTTDNAASHRRIWDELDGQNGKLADHDKRLAIVEHTIKN